MKHIWCWNFNHRKSKIQTQEQDDSSTNSIAMESHGPHHHQQQHREVLAVDLDHTLAKLLESAIQWRNAENDSEVRIREKGCD